MARNFLIGIGGTGARVIEAMLHCCAAGLGPDKLFVFLVDPDEGNGNLSRTKALLSAYRTCHQGLRERINDDVRLFRTEIIAPEPFVWSIFKKQKQTLADYVNHEMLRPKDPDLVDLIDLLFSKRELQTPLDEGFRGHPSIGAVAMAGPEMDAEPWKSFWGEVAECRSREARVMLVGSIFGGTGAAGVPTFGAREMLKFREKATLDAAHGDSKILLGAALVLPYFSVRAEAIDESEMFVTSDDFPIATKAALEYYDEKDLAFDQIYLIGDSLASKVGTFSPGSVSQQNRSHYIELVSALASLDFYRRPLNADLLEKQYYAAGRKDARLDWDALPVASDPDLIRTHQAELKLRLTTFTAFSYAFLSYGDEILRAAHDSLRSLPWYRENFAFDARKPDSAIHHDPRQGASQDTLKAASTCCRRFLHWISEMDEGSVHLVDRTKLWSDEAKGTVAGHVQHPKSIATFLKDTAGERDFASFVTILNDVSLGGRNLRPAERMLNLFYEGASQFCRSNYSIAGSKGAQ